MTTIQHPSGFTMVVDGVPEKYWKHIDPSRISKLAAARCEDAKAEGWVCRGWLETAIINDASHDWIACHDSCQHESGEWFGFGDARNTMPSDEDACAAAAIETGRTMAWAIDPSTGDGRDDDGYLYYAPYLMPKEVTA